MILTDSLIISVHILCVIVDVIIKTTNVHRNFKIRNIISDLT